MNQIFPFDKKGFFNQDIELKSPIFIEVKDSSLIPCAKFFNNYLKNKGFSGIIKIKKDNLPKTYCSFIFFLSPSSQREIFQLTVEKKSGCYTVKFSGTSILCCYYAVQAFLRETQICKTKLKTKIKYQNGKTKNNYRNLIISLSWMENLIEFPFFDLEKWKRFISFVSELRFHRIDFMQWGCTIPDPPNQNHKIEDEWILWETQKKEKSDWPIPEAYKNLKYQEGVWKNRKLFQPWLFPIKGKYITNADKFSVCYPPENKIPLSYWDINKQKLVQIFWRPPFIHNRDLFKKIVSLIHSYGMRAGIFTTPRVPCVNCEKDFIKYWEEIIMFFLQQGIDDFVFETEEGPASFEHHKKCKNCQKAYGDIFTGYTIKIAHQTKLLNNIILKNKKDSDIGWICHVPLNGGYGNPLERKKWLENPVKYIENLKIFKNSTFENLKMNYVPQPGSHGIMHQFLPKIYFDIFGFDNIRQTGYTHAWGPARAFFGLEAYFIEESYRLWTFDPLKNKHIWKNKSISKDISFLSLKLYGSKKTINDLTRYSINNHRITSGVKSAVCPYIWDRGMFCIKQQILTKMLESATKEKKQNYLLYPEYFYLNLLKRLIAAEKRLKDSRINNFLFSSGWDFKEGFQERYSLVKASTLSVKYLLILNNILIEFSKKRKVKIKELNHLIKVGSSINNKSAYGHKTSLWPSSSRLGGLYDYYAFALILKTFFARKNLLHH